MTRSVATAKRLLDAYNLAPSVRSAIQADIESDVWDLIDALDKVARYSTQALDRFAADLPAWPDLSPGASGTVASYAAKAEAAEVRLRTRLNMAVTASRIVEAPR
jgi:hypothetical protein